MQYKGSSRSNKDECSTSRVQHLPSTLATEARIRKHMTMVHVPWTMLIKNTASGSRVKSLAFVTRALAPSCCIVASVTRDDSSLLNSHIETADVCARRNVGTTCSRNLETRGKSISMAAGRSCSFSGNVWRQSFCASALYPGNRKFTVTESMIRRHHN